MCSTAKLRIRPGDKATVYSHAIQAKGVSTIEATKAAALVIFANGLINE